MPAEITITTPDLATDYQMVFPDTSVRIAVHDIEENTDDVIMVRCMKKDHGSDIFVFPQPEGIEDGPGLLEYCTPETFCEQISDDGSERLLNAHSRNGVPITIMIGHRAIMAAV